ncbi:hypothetical protein BO70DRAFT_13639 [Aspergillus heteromorphus CBS 117.55]|uniref:Uncharacterized protein n=1 Tax=Aspergillus heteromorphus CBS 117.55 TaxID=1448321 RepID=A0A317X6Q2_9EURO|nr:uncharacterized protein BO70DRAFT_13639 [Aspergillus heteromorphus CBS 117.55]PWY92558.1 hypothetical protein BO70DRAFT_13639 [Aspergillus heteromorphus CBS 117.55]
MCACAIKLILRKVDLFCGVRCSRRQRRSASSLPQEHTLHGTRSIFVRVYCSPHLTHAKLTIDSHFSYTPSQSTMPSTPAKRPRRKPEEPEAKHVEVADKGPAPLDLTDDEADQRLYNRLLNLGESAPTPRWLIEAPGDADPPRQLRWKFDPGDNSRNPQESDDFYRENYEHLRIHLHDMFFRDRLIDYIKGNKDLMRVVGNAENSIPLLNTTPRPAGIKNRPVRHPMLYKPNPALLPPAGLTPNAFTYEGFNRPRPISRAIEREEEDASDEGHKGPLHRRVQKKFRRLIPQRAGGGATKGECKCVWFTVILLVLSTFLCLFLYAFRIIT